MKPARFDRSERLGAALGSGHAGCMQAVVVDSYGGPEVANVAMVSKPKAGAGDVLVEVRASAICRGDVHVMTGEPYVVRLSGFGVFRPKHRIPGQSVSGRVTAIGEGVGEFCAGDEVFGEIPGGAWAQWVAAPARLFARKPARLDHEQAAAVPLSGLTALQALRDAGQLRHGESVVINGASGAVGTLTVQIAKAMGAVVTAVCSTRNIEFVRSLGADCVVDYSRQDFTGLDPVHDLMIDLAGNRSIRECLRALKIDGRLVACGALGGSRVLGPLARIAAVEIEGRRTGRRLRSMLAKPNRADLCELARMLDAGTIRPVIDQRYPLKEITAALRHMTSGSVRGATILSMECA